jgi:tetratricopeptide (TPR) repeat protein
LTDRAVVPSFGRVWRVVLLVGLAIVASAADPPGTDASRAARAECEAADAASGAARTERLHRTLERADAAIAADDRDALAHFAAFCALGGLLKDEGIGLAAPGRMRRLRREVDRTLELAPDFADALAGKGALLCHLPRLLGGDAAAGERLLRRALEIDPDYLTPRLELVDALRARGATGEAREHATRALALAERKGSREDAAAARAALAALDQGAVNP